jgi:hypothetical protein
MLLRRFTDYILRGRVHALAAAFVLVLVPIIGCVIATFVTLRKGAQEGAFVFIALILPYLLIMMMAPSEQVSGENSNNLLEGVIFIVSISFVSWLIAVILRATSSWSVVLDSLALISVAVIILIHLYYPDMAQFREHWLKNYFELLQQAAKDFFIAIGMSNSSIVNILNKLKDLTAGITTLMFSSQALLFLLLARWWQDAMFNPGGLRKELKTIRLSKVCAIVFIVGLFAAFQHIVMMQNAIIILFMIFALAGFSLMHYIITAKKINFWLVGFVYIALSIFPKSMVFLVLAGLLDAFFDFRKRLPVKSLIS